MTEFPARTESLCPICLRRIAAQRIVENDEVYLEKSCPEHGDFERILLWRNYPKSYSEWHRSNASAPGQKPANTTLTPSGELQPAYSERKGCPYDCGICSNHKQHTCSAIVEVTHRCNIHCPVCFAESQSEADKDPDLRQIEQMLQTVRDRAGLCPIQLSGGEPTVRNDLPQIIAVARKTGFDHIQINTNGIRLAQDADYGQALKDAGATDFFLQFDGLTDDTYLHLRGAALLPFKLKAIERCAALRIGIILVPTVVRNINDTQLGDIIGFAKKWMPAVKGVHFQPFTYLGRYPSPPRNEDRILIPDILVAIENQTRGQLKAENFIPPG